METITRTTPLHAWPASTELGAIAMVRKRETIPSDMSMEIHTAIICMMPTAPMSTMAGAM